MKKIAYLDILTSLLPLNERDAFLEYYNKPLPKNINIIQHKCTDEAMIHLYIDGLSRPGQHFLHQGGFFYLQEFSASLPAQVLLQSLKTQNIISPLILDMCASPGGKSIQLADSGGFIVSNEPSDSRRKALIYNINRTGVYNTILTNYDGTKIGNLLANTFDSVLVDAPCSGEGMNYKIPIQSSRDEIKIKQIAGIQYQLLKSGILACKPGGTIVYSTCTLNCIENEGVIAHILQEFKGIVALENIDIPNKSHGLTHRQGQKVLGKEEADKLARFRPHIHHIGGFFIARFQKISPTKEPTLSAQQSIKKFECDVSDKLQNTVKEKLLEDFGITLDKEYLFLATQNNIYTTSPDYLKTCPGQSSGVHGLLHAQKVGIPIYTIGRNIRIPTHHLGNILGHLATKNTYTLSDDEAQKYSDHQELPLDHEIKKNDEGFIILKWKKYGFSIGKSVSGRIKNKMI